MNSLLKQIIDQEYQRQQNTIGLIPSENFSSKAVREAVGSVLMHKYSEGYPAKRYYEGNEVIDSLEELAIRQIKKVFGVGEEWHANVQTLSGSTANLAVYNSVLNPGDKILSMFLPDGGHLSHGWSYSKKSSVVSMQFSDSNKSQLPVTLSEVEGSKPKAQGSQLMARSGDVKVSIVSKIYEVIQYKTDPSTMLFDYDEIQKIAEAEKPKLIVTGGTAYPRNIDYERMSQIAKSVGAYYMADVAHEAGLIAAGVVPSPFDYADFVTFTTHKTLRGPKGAVAMCKSEYAADLDRSVFPGMQGGPFNHNIAGITQAFFEAETSEFKEYAQQVVKNAQAMAVEFKTLGYKVISGGTDKHLVLIDIANRGLSGKYASAALAQVGIISNMNTVPWDSRTPFNPSGLRLGTPLITTRGMKEEQVKLIVGWIDQILTLADKLSPNPEDQKLLELDSFLVKLNQEPLLKNILKEVRELCEKFPLE